MVNSWSRDSLSVNGSPSARINTSSKSLRWRPARNWQAGPAQGSVPLATTITEAGALVIAGMRLRAGKSNSRKGAGRDGRPGDRHRPRRRDHGADLGARRQRLRHPRGGRGLPPRRCPILAGADQEHRRAEGDRRDPRGWMDPVRYPGAVEDPDTGMWISDAEVAEISYTAFASTKDAITARLMVRRVKDARHSDALFRCGGITRSSPTQTSRSPTPTSPTAATP